MRIKAKVCCVSGSEQTARTKRSRQRGQQEKQKVITCQAGWSEEAVTWKPEESVSSCLFILNVDW